MSHITAAPDVSSLGVQSNAVTAERFAVTYTDLISAVAVADSDGITKYTVASAFNYSAGMTVTTAACTNAANNGSFVVRKTDVKNNYLYLVNAAGVAEGSPPAAANVSYTGDAIALHVSTAEGGGIAADIEGNIAHDAVDSGNPVKVGGKAHTSEPAAVANNDRVNAYFDENGYQRTKGQDPSVVTQVDGTNLAAATNYYPSAAGQALGDYKDLNIQGIISGGVTVTLEVSNDDDWADITQAGYDKLTDTTGNPSFIDTNFNIDFDNINCKLWRIVSVTSDATNAVKYVTRMQ